MQNLPKVELSDFYVEFIEIALSILVIMWVKDLVASFMEGMKFRTNKHFNEGDKVLLDGKQAMIISIGSWCQFSLFSRDFPSLGVAGPIRKPAGHV